MHEVVGTLYSCIENTNANASPHHLWHDHECSLGQLLPPKPYYVYTAKLGAHSFKVRVASTARPLQPSQITAAPALETGTYRPPRCIQRRSKEQLEVLETPPLAVLLGRVQLGARRVGVDRVALEVVAAQVGAHEGEVGEERPRELEDA